MVDSSTQGPVNQANHEDVEEYVVKFDDEDIRESVNKCSKSLIGKLLSDRNFSVGTLESALHAIWRHREEMAREFGD
ncbi:hypothetical protein PIB30_046877 [Stylosanthes scabra]|uniref:Uncharacterized protein n=1 Tax=Stylosanthes scabra TaxID=79078 RepID=A0ABU6RH81_9FABA|nr:hypothetical protein [Stylosanthes scabra]